MDLFKTHHRHFCIFPAGIILGGKSIYYITEDHKGRDRCNSKEDSGFSGFFRRTELEICDSWIPDRAFAKPSRYFLVISMISPALRGFTSIFRKLWLTTELISSTEDAVITISDTCEGNESIQVAALS